MKNIFCENSICHRGIVANAIELYQALVSSGVDIFFKNRISLTSRIIDTTDMMKLESSSESQDIERQSSSILKINRNVKGRVISAVIM